MSKSITINKKNIRLTAIALFLLSCALYSQTMFFDFVWDDNSAITVNPYIRSLSTAVATFYSKAEPQATLNRNSNANEITEDRLFISEKRHGMFQLPANNWRPLRTTIHALIYKIDQANPFYFHLANIIAHALVVVLLLLVLIKITGSLPSAVIGALLFAVHPVNTEAVCWAKEFEDMMAAGLLLLSFNFFLRLQQSKRYNILLSLAIAVSYALALTAKLSVIFFPAFLALLLLYQHSVAIGWFKQQNSVISSIKKFFTEQKKLLIIIAVLATEVVSALVARTIILGRIGQHGYVTGNCWTTWLNMPYIFLRYLYIEFIPYPLYSDYQGFPVHTSLTSVGAWMYVIGFMVIFVLLSYILYRQRFLAPWLWFWCALIPFSNILPMDQLAGERFLYIPTIATAWLGALLFKRYTEPYSLKKYKYTIIVTVVVVVILAAMTLKRAATWQNPKTLFSTIVEQLPRSGRARNNLISAYIFDDEIIKAFNEAKILIKLYPNHPGAKKSYGKTLCLMGRFNEGVKILYQEKAHIELNFIGVTAAQNGLFKQATTSFRLAAKLAPDNLRYHKNLARASKLLAKEATRVPPGALLDKPQVTPSQQNSPQK